MTKKRSEELRKAELFAQSLEGHRPKRRHTHSDEHSYVVMPDGSWLRVTKRDEEKQTDHDAKLGRAAVRFSQVIK